MFKRNGQPDPSIVHSFEQHKSSILNFLRRLILKNPITNAEWQNLIYEVHLVCSWDARGPEKLLKYMRKELDESYILHVKCRLSSVQDGYQQLKEYAHYWTDFKQLCDKLPLAFHQLDLATRDALLKGAFHSKNNNAPVIKTGPCNKSSNKVISPTYPAIKKQAFSRNGLHYSTVRCLMIKKWADDIIVPFFPRLLSTSMTLIANERSGLIIDSGLILDLRESLSYLEELRIIEYDQSFMQLFERYYVQSIEQGYSSIPDEYLRKHDIIEYIQWALDKLNREELKAQQYLDTYSTAQFEVTEACKRCLIVNFVEQLIVAAKRYVLRNDVDSMHFIYKFLDKVNGAVERLLKDEFQYHIIVTGQDNLNNLDPQETGNPDGFVEKLLEVYSKFDRIVDEAFSNDIRARCVFEESMALLVNDPGIFNSGVIDAKTGTESRCPDLLANYCNLLFRKSAVSKKLTHEDLSIRMNELYLIIKLLKNKDSFLKTHRYHLIRRLILDASINLDREEEFITSLKGVSGIALDETNELLRMFKDLKSSDMLNRKFLKSMKPTNSLELMNNNNTITDITSQITDRLNFQENNNQASPIQVKVLNPSAWAKNLERSSIMLPQNVTSLMPSFEAFYKSEYDGRELDWCHQLSNGIVTFKNNTGYRYDLEVTAAQLSILSAFDEKPMSKKSLDDLRAASCLNAVELRRTLWVS